MPCRRHDPALNSELDNTTAGKQRWRRLNDLMWFSTMNVRYSALWRARRPNRHTPMVSRTIARR